jgi:hypothetical protein
VVRRQGAEEFGGYLRTLASLLPEPMFGVAPPPALAVVVDDVAAAAVK